MNSLAYILLLQVVAFWSVWQWYAVRMSGAPDEAWGLIALATAMVCVFLKREPTTQQTENTRLALTVATTTVVLYTMSYPYAPPLVRAGVAMLSVACTLGFMCGKGRRGTSVGIGGLLLLALPVIPSLQFYGGYPLRVLVAQAAAPLLQLSGFAVVPRGTCLDWGGRLIWIDAPCSGVRMLWVGLYLACTLISFHELRLARAVLALLASMAIIITGNIVRAVALFYIEAGIIRAPAWTHEAVGVLSFAFVGISVLLLVEGLRRRKLWDELRFM